MKDTLITHKTAYLSKDKGFKLPNSTDYIEAFDLSDNTLTTIRIEDQDMRHVAIQVSQSVLQKHLREKHNIHIEIKVSDLVKDTNCYSWSIFGKYNTIIIKRISNSGKQTKEFYDTYEEALEEGLYQGLKYTKCTTIKVSSHNTITIKSVKSQWSKEELLSIAIKAFNNSDRSISFEDFCRKEID